LGVDTALHALAPSVFPKDASFRCEAHAAWPVARRLGVSPAMNRRLRDVGCAAHIIHNHSLWMLPNIYPHWAARHSGCRLVTSPRGTLSPVALRISRLRKHVMWWFGQRKAVRESDCLHATSEAEYRDIRRAGLLAPVAVIPNGIDLPPMVREETPAGGRPRRLLFLARVHPIKGVDALLRAWRQVQAEYPEWELHIVGPADSPSYLNTLRALASDLGVCRAEFAGPTYGPAKSRAFRNSDLYVLPTHSENFGITIAEALAHGVPVITTHGAPWAGLQEHGCGWWIERGSGPLAACMREVLARSPAELRQCGERGRVWMDRDFSWSRIARMTRDTYFWLLGGGSPPDWVRINKPCVELQPSLRRPSAPPRKRWAA